MIRSDRDAEVRAKALVSLGVHLVLANGALLVLQRWARRSEARRQR